MKNPIGQPTALALMRMPRDRSTTITPPEVLFGQTLRKLRTDRAISQKTLAFDSGYHLTYISQLERGKKNPSLRAIIRLASALGTSPSDILKTVEQGLSASAAER